MLIEQFKLMQKYNLKEIRIQIDGFMRWYEITLYSNNNRAFRRVVPIDELSRMDSTRLYALFSNMCEELHNND